MKKSARTIVSIDEELCNGCGQCILDCAEGAIVLVDGKAKVIADMYCDGLGACLSGCPTGALTLIQREADAYDEAAVEAHLSRQGRSLHHGVGRKGHGHGGHEGHGGHKDAPHTEHGAEPGHHAGRPQERGQHSGKGCACGHSAPQEFAPSACGCPSSQASVFPLPKAGASRPAAGTAPFAMAGRTLPGNTHWPLKIRLMSPDAPFLKGADLLVAADCSAFAAAGFHSQLRPGTVLLIGCPKFEDEQELTDKLADIFRVARPASCTVVRMEVPCCRGLLAACRAAGAASGVEVPLRDVIISRPGDISVQGS